MQSLYEISQDLLTIYSQLEESGGEITPDIEESLALNDQSFSTKALNYCKFIQSLKATANMFDLEIDRLRAKKERAAKLADTLKNNLAGYMTLSGKDKVDLDLFKLSFRNSKAVSILSEDIPEEFTRIKIEPDKIKIKEALEAGQFLEFAELQNNKSLQIK